MNVFAQSPNVLGSKPLVTRSNLSDETLIEDVRSQTIRSTLPDLQKGVVFMKLGFISINVPGHLNPMTALARRLQARNHEVVFLYSSGAAGLPFVPGPEKDHVNEGISGVSKMRGDDVLELSVRLVLAQTETILKSLPATVAATGVDALVLDAVQWYAGIGGDAAGHAVCARVKRLVL